MFHPQQHVSPHTYHFNTVMCSATMLLNKTTSVHHSPDSRQTSKLFTSRITTRIPPQHSYFSLYDILNLQIIVNQLIYMYVQWYSVLFYWPYYLYL